MKIDIWSDLVCPWCWIGTQRLYTALHALGDAASSIETRWHPFQIDPAVGDTPVPLLDFYEQKFGSRERGRQIIAQTQAAGRADGLPFDYERGQVRLNTRNAHRLVWLAGKEGDAAAVMRALFQPISPKGAASAIRRPSLTPAWPEAWAKHAYARCLSRTKGWPKCVPS